MTTTQTKRNENARRIRRANEFFVNRIKMANGCSRCGFTPKTEAECPLLDLNHDGGGRIGAWATKSVGKSADVSRLVWSGDGLARIWAEIQKGSWLCKNCHCLEHVEDSPLVESTEIFAQQRAERFWDSLED